MEIYVIVETSIWEYEICPDKVFVFKDKEKAKKQFEKLCKAAKKDIKEFTNDFVIDKTEDFFCVYEQGYYSQTHCDITLHKKFLED